MAGAVTHKWPDAVRDAIVSAVFDHGMSQRRALRAAHAGELPGLTTPNGQLPSRSTIAGWIQTEQRKRDRETKLRRGPTEITEEGLTQAAADAVAELEKLRRRPGTLDVERYGALIDLLGKINRASPRTNTRPSTPTHGEGNGTKTDGDGTTPSELAARLAARAHKTTNTQPPTQRETAPAQQQDHEHGDTEAESDSVERAHDEAPAVVA